MVQAIMRDGRVLTLAAKYGTTKDEVVAAMRATSLTGSGAPPDVELETEDGGTISYADVNKLA